jgi:hypothetical protein
LDHSIIAGNSAENGPDVFLAAEGTIDSSFSLIGDIAGADLPESPAGRADERGNFIGGPLHGVIDPRLATLADNGSLVLPGGARLLTQALLPGSPAIDGGDATLSPGEGETPEFDQRGAPYARVVGQRMDLGAIERQEVGYQLGG